MLWQTGIHLLELFILILIGIEEVSYIVDNASKTEIICKSPIVRDLTITNKVMEHLFSEGYTPYYERHKNETVAFLTIKILSKLYRCDEMKFL